MPPKVKISREDIIRAAVDIVRRSGETALNARNIAAELSCSTQPVFSNFATMDELRLAVMTAADELSREYIKNEVEKGHYPPYKASGMAYIAFARRERELFRLLYMCDRRGEGIPVNADLFVSMENLVRSNGIERDRAQLFHLEMWTFVHGIAAMIATNYIELEEELVSAMLTDAFQGLKKRFEGE